jgi:hypothetical protein
MLSWFKKKEPRSPGVGPGNPGFSTGGRLDLDLPEGPVTEELDLVALTEEVLRARGHTVERREDVLIHPDTGLELAPQIAALDFAPTGLRGCCTVEARHPAFGTPAPFEYQHFVGPRGPATPVLREALDQWAQVDFAVLLDALRPLPEASTLLEIPAGSADGGPPRARRVLLGPVAHLATNPGPEEEHPFCACCFVTRCAEALRPLFEAEAFYAVRFFAARDERGRPQADCRVNGEDWDPAAQALKAYVKTWPARGFEFRKQYAVFHTGAPVAAGQPSPRASPARPVA